MKEKRLIHIYTGDGKGKTTAGLGLCLRAAGSGMNVLIVRFLKKNNSGELTALERFENIELIPNDKEFGFSKIWKNDPETKKQASEYYNSKLEAAISKAESGAVDLLFMDEILASVRLGVVDTDRLLSFLRNKPEKLEVVMTGRDPLPELVELADYVSEIRKIKHPFDRKIGARKGIEF